MAEHTTYNRFYRVHPESPLSDKWFVTDLWFQIVDQINASSDLLQTRYGGKACFMEFLQDLDWTILQSSSVFEAARSEIDENHDEFITTLELLAKDFYVQEVAYALLTRIEFRDDQARGVSLTRTWLEVKQCIERTGQETRVHPKSQRSSLKSIAGSGRDPHNEISTSANKCINFLDRCNNHSKASEETCEPYLNHSCHHTNAMCSTNHL